MAEDDDVYFRRRAEQELELAQRAVDCAVVRAHYRLAEAYLDKITPPKAPSAEPERFEKPIDPLFDFSTGKSGRS